MQKWDWQRRLREEEKKERKIVNNNEVHHSCVRIRHKERY
jgi:hypothetical protein